MTTAILTSIGVLIVSAASVALNEVATQAAAQGLIQEWTEWQWATFPLIGAFLAAVTSVAYRNERVRDTVGNFVACAVVGVMGPKVVTLLHPMLKHYGTDSILLIGFGYLWGAVGFALGKWFFSWLGRRGPQIAEGEAESWAQKREKDRQEAPKDRT